MDNTDLKVVVETPEERRKRFLIEFEKPFKCEKCNERFKKKKYLLNFEYQWPFLLKWKITLSRQFDIRIK